MTGATAEAVVQFLLKSATFESGGWIPRQHTCDGKDVSPPLFWTGVPEKAVSLALIVDDPDAPRKRFVHWVLYDLPASAAGLPERVPPGAALEQGGFQGANDFGNVGYGGPCPPSGTHSYIFTLYALDTKLRLKSRATKEDVLRAAEGHILGEARLVGRYARK